MTNQQILGKAISRAIDGGWLPYFATFDSNMTKDNITIRYPEGASAVNFDYEMRGHIVGVGGYNMEPFSIIFNHDFAKALWGEEWSFPAKYSEERENTIPWKYHLQQMAVAENPIQYLGTNI